MTDSVSISNPNCNSGTSISQPLYQGSGILKKEGAERLGESDVIEDSKEAVLSGHSGTDAHMNSKQL